MRNQSSASFVCGLAMGAMVLKACESHIMGSTFLAAWFALLGLLLFGSGYLRSWAERKRDDELDRLIDRAIKVSNDCHDTSVKALAYAKTLEDKIREGGE